MEPRKKEFRLQLYARAAAPCRDYYGLTINEDTIVFNTWNISHGPHVYPKMTRNYLYDYPDNKSLQNDVARLFGSYVNDYILQLANDKITLHCLPTRAFLSILAFLAKKDIIHLSQTSKIFFQLCQTDNVWRLIFKKILKRKPTYYEEQDAIDRGWKQVLNNKLFRLKNIGPTPAHIKSGKIQSKIKYNSLKLENDETDGQSAASAFSKGGGDTTKPLSILKKSTKEVKGPPKPLKNALKCNPAPLNSTIKNVNKPTSKCDIIKKSNSSATLLKPMEEQYTSTLARRTLRMSAPKVKAVQSIKK